MKNTHVNIDIAPNVPIEDVSRVKENIIQIIISIHVKQEF